jgi:hypothetical protein
MRIYACVWRTCAECEAPLTRPLPEGWTYTVEMPRSGIAKVMQHYEDCPDGFVKVKLPNDDER